MRPSDKVEITARDYATIEDLLEKTSEQDQVFVPLLRRRIVEARVVFGDDIETDRATIDSRIAFRVNDGPQLVKTLALRSEDSEAEPILPLISFLGIALLGLRAGDSAFAEPLVGQRETVFLDAVLFQPEADFRTGKTIGEPRGQQIGMLRSKHIPRL